MGVAGKMVALLWCVATLAGWACPAARAQDSGRLLATGGVVSIDGAGGGGLVPWATIAGYGTRDAVGGSVHDTAVLLPDFTLNTAGAAIGLMNRVELSYTHDWLDTGATGGRLGIGKGYQFALDVAGAKVRLFGDAVYDQDSWLPQVAVGSEFKSNDSHAVLRAIGAKTPDGVDVYVAATKLFLRESLLLDATVRLTRADQYGLLGFGGDRSDGMRPEFEGSAALLLSRRIAVGTELRMQPDELGFAPADTAWDLFGAWFISKHVSATIAFAALGRIARQGVQDGAFVSLVTGF